MTIEKSERDRLHAEIDSLRARLSDAKQLLRIRETDLKEIRRLGQIGNWSWDIATDRHSWSEEIFIIYGRDPGLPPAQYPEVGACFTVESWAGLSQAVEECLRTGTAYECEAEVVRADGTRRWVVARGEAELDGAGSVARLYGTVQDITDRKRSVEAVRSNEERLRLALDAAHLATWDWHIPSGFVVWNSEHYRMLGYEPDSFLPTYRHWADRVHPDDLPATEKRIRRAIAEGGEYRAEFRVVLPDGTVRILGALGRFERDETGCAVRQYGAMSDITDQKRVIDKLNLDRELLEQRVAERTRELRESESKYRILFDNEIYAICIFDPETGAMLDVNDAHVAMYGYSRSELLSGVKAFDLSAEPDASAASVRGIVERGSMFVPLRHHRKKDGTVFPVEIVGGVYVWRGNRVMFGMAHDISERILAEKEREQYCRFFQTSSDLMVIADPNGAFLQTNPVCTEVLGYSAEELVAKPFIDFVHPDDRQPTLDEMIRQQELGFSLEFENRYICKDGSFRWLAWRAVYDRDEGRTYATARDITLNRQQEEALRRSEMEFRMLAEAMPQIVWVTGPDGKNIYFNQRWVDYTGLTLEESCGDGWVRPFYPDDRQMAWDAWQNAVHFRGRYSLECRIRRADGAYRWWLVRGVPLLDEQGAVLKWFGTCTDIDEVKRAEEERLALELQMQQTQKLESLGILAGGIAHDFNNILTAIIGNASLALMKLDPRSAVVSNLRQIEKAAERAADLSRQMLAYSGKGKFLIERLDLNSLLEEMRHMLEISISKKAVLKMDLASFIPAIEADATQIRQVIMNLVINASEAIGDAAGLITITTGCRHCSWTSAEEAGERVAAVKGEYVFLEIADTGCGMSDEIMEKIFDPFFTTKFTGRGLGMAVVHGIVRGHSGAIEVESEPGKGSTFRVLLPASGRPPDARLETAFPDAWEGKGVVLLADDEAVVRDVGSEMLKSLGYTVVAARDGKEAVEVFASRDDISFVILDLTMPRMDGEECFRELRRLRPGVRVIMSSGYS